MKLKELSLIIEPKKFKIRIKVLEGNILTFHNVVSYELEENLIKFIDTKTGDKKIFSSLNCEIEEESLKGSSL